MVCRNVLRAELQGAVERPAQDVAAEARNAEDQIHGDVSEAAAPGRPHRLLGLRRGVAAVHQPQAVVVEGLDADREAVDARFAQGREVGLVQIVGVGLEGRLLGSGAVEELRGVFEQPADRPGRTERRRAAPEVAGADGLAAQVVAARLQFAVHGFDERVEPPGADLLEKVAVGAGPFAERYVEIDSGHCYQR